MSTLLIQPVAYKGTRLSEIGERLVSVFYPTLTDYQIGSDLPDQSMDKFLRNVGKHKTISSRDFLRFLADYRDGGFLDGNSPISIND